MRLTMLHIYEAGYGADVRLQGTVKFSNASGEVQLTLRQEHIRGVLEAVADALVTSSREVANEMTAQIIEQSVPKIAA
jgi:cobalamin biosynthesis protein CbiD